MIKFRGDLKDDTNLMNLIQSSIIVLICVELMM